MVKTKDGRIEEKIRKETRGKEVKKKKKTKKEKNNRDKEDGKRVVNLEQRRRNKENGTISQVDQGFWKEDEWENANKEDVELYNEFKRKVHKWKIYLLFREERKEVQ